MSKQLIKIETAQGWEVWPATTDSPLVAVFVRAQDADRFIASYYYPDFQEIALKVAEAYPDLNLSGAPLNPRGELVRNIARIVKKNWKPYRSDSHTDLARKVLAQIDECREHGTLDCRAAIERLFAREGIEIEDEL